MDFTKIAQNLIADLTLAYSELAIKEMKDDEEKFGIKFEPEEQIRVRIHGMSWKSKSLENLKKTTTNLLNANQWAEWMINHVHLLACKPVNDPNPPSFKSIHALNPYLPSDTALEAVKTENPLQLLKNNNAVLGKYIVDRNLNANNIHEIFRVLLELEDIANLEEYVPLIQRNVTLVRGSARTIYNARYNVGTPKNIKDILTPNLDVVVVVPAERSKSLKLKSDVSSIKRIISKFIEFQKFTAFVYDVSDTSVCIQFKKPINLKENKIKFDLIFYSTRFPIRYQSRALDMLTMNIQMRKYLFPQNNLQKTSIHPVNDFELLNSEIANNPEQKQAVCYISSGLNPCAPYIVFGPPGTGKTTTIVESILQLRLQQPGSRILVTAGSNSACDTIALRICQYFKSSPRLRKHLNTAEVLPVIRVFSKSVQKSHIEAMSKDLLQRSNIAWNRGTHAYPAVEDILKYGIVIATLCTVGKLVCGNINVSNSFTHVFIDEAAASSEPETLVGIMGIKKSINDNCRIILSGDHKQLGPVLKSSSAVKFGLGSSLMQRILDCQCYALDKNGNYDRTLQTRLRRNYRSHEEIVKLYNFLYYNNELLAMKSLNDLKFKRNWSFLPDSIYPIVFQAVHGVTTNEESTSSCNKLEINVLIWYIKRLIHVDGVKQTDIGVITPYKLQCQHIRQRLNSHNWKNIEVGSVENFQGREKEIIIVSMVRSFVGLGFLENPRRFNVLLSRAKSLLLIMGNPVCLRYIKDMNYVIEKCKNNGTYLRKEKDK